MAFIRGTFAPAWLVTLSPIALFGLGTDSPGAPVLVVVVGGLMAAALILTLASKRRTVVRVMTSPGARARAASDERDLIRLDSDLG
jgi:hypothetical protein